MAYKILVMPSAEADLDEYAIYIARDSERHSREWLSKAWNQIMSLAENPNRFRVIPEAEELGAELRAVLHYSHRIIYQVNEFNQIVEILRVYHGAREPLTEQDIR